MVDQIADMLTRIRNAKAVLHPTVAVPFSKLKYNIAKILEKNGFVGRVNKIGKRTKRAIDITLKYNGRNSVITGLRRVSKPGQRIYTSKRVKRVKAGYGIAVVSTSKGLMTDREARKQGLGGEIICEIW